MTEWQKQWCLGNIPVAVKLNTGEYTCTVVKRNMKTAWVKFIDPRSNKEAVVKVRPHKLVYV